MFRNATIISTLIFLSSCGITLYIPNTINTPLLHEKDDYNAKLGLVTSVSDPALDLQGAYAISDHFETVLNASFMNAGNNSSSLKTNHYFVEAGGGPYATFLRHQGFDIGRVEFLGGYGFGWAKDHQNREQYSGRYQRAFLQPGLGLRGRILEVSVATRFGFVNFSDYRVSANGGTTEVDQFGFITAEPVITFSLGYKYAKLYLQLGGKHALSNQENYDRITSSENETHVNLGVNVSPWIEEKDVEPKLTFSLPPSPLLDSLGPLQLPPPVIHVSEPETTICFQSGNQPPNFEMVRIAFGATFLAKKLQPNEDPQCFEVTLKEGASNSLRLWLHSEGIKKGGTVLLSIQSGKEEQWFYIRPEMEKKEELWLLVK